MESRDDARQPLPPGEEQRPIRSSSSVQEYVEEWLSRQQPLRPWTYASHEAHVRRYLVPYLGNLPLDGLRPHHIERMYRLIADEDSRGRGPHSDSSLRRIHTTLTLALSSAVERGLLDHNPSATINLPRTLSRGSTTRTADPARRIDIPEPQLFTAKVSVRGVQTTLEFLAQSWGEATEVLHKQYGDSAWVLTLKGAAKTA